MWGHANIGGSEKVRLNVSNAVCSIVITMGTLGQWWWLKIYWHFKTFSKYMQTRSGKERVTNNSHTIGIKIAHWRKCRMWCGVYNVCMAFRDDRRILVSHLILYTIFSHGPMGMTFMRGVRILFGIATYTRMNGDRSLIYSNSFQSLWNGPHACPSSPFGNQLTARTIELICISHSRMNQSFIRQVIPRKSLHNAIMMMIAQYSSLSLSFWREHIRPSSN